MNLIVGGTGFIGGHLAEYFFQEGEISKGVFRKGSHLRIMDQCGIQILEADLIDKESLHEALEMVNVVYNLASPTPDHEGQGDYLEVNTKGLRNLLEEAEEHGVNDFVHLSTLGRLRLQEEEGGREGMSPAGSSPSRTLTRRQSSRPRWRSGSSPRRAARCASRSSGRRRRPALGTRQSLFPSCR